MIIGYTTGKFMPLHKGHELVLNLAASVCDLLIVHIDSADGPYSVVQRHGWIAHAAIKYGISNKVQIRVTDFIPGEWKTDDNGTIIDDEFWDLYLEQLRDQVIGNHTIDYVFSSDKYGAEIAERLDSKWVPIDPDRQVMPISATQIRRSPFNYSSMIPDYVLQDISKVVAIVGPESVGKSTMVQNLGKVLNVMVANEWGRTCFEATRHVNEISGALPSGILTEEDFFHIYIMQAMMIKHLATQQYLTITDTEAITTTIFQEDLCPDQTTVDAVIEKWKKNSGIDMYIILAPTVPFVQDGTRFEDEQHRQDVFERLTKRLEGHPNVVVITSSDYTERFNQALNAIAELTRAL